MDHGYDDIFFPEIAVEAGAAANEFVEFAGDFDPAEPGAHDDEMEEPAASFFLLTILHGNSVCVDSACLLACSIKRV